MILVTNEKMVRLIAIGKKTTHRFLANRKIETGEVTHPKIAAGKIHKVYTQAPFGTDGNPDAPPLLEVMIDKVEPDVLNSLTLKDARSDGYASVEAFVAAWNVMHKPKAMYFEKNLFSPIWVVSFTFKNLLPAGEKLIKKIERQMKAQAKKKA